MPPAVAEAQGQSRNAVPVHDAISDKAHRAPDDVGSAVPFGRAGCRVRHAALACPEAGPLGGCCGREKTHPRRPGGRRRTARPAVDARRGDRHKEPAVEAGVTAAHCQVPGLVVERRGDRRPGRPARERRFPHASSLSGGGPRVWRKSDIGI